MAQPSIPGRPLPQATVETVGYWQAAGENRLVMQRCNACGHVQFPPRAFCTHCLSDALEWAPTGGRGHVHTFTVCRIAPSAAFESQLPYVVAIVELDEGVRLLANILGVEPDRVTVGARVAVCFERVSEDCTLPQFTLSDKPSP